MTIAKSINIFIITDEETKKGLEKLLIEIKKDENKWKVKEIMEKASGIKNKK